MPECCARLLQGSEVPKGEHVLKLRWVSDRYDCIW